MIGRTVDGIHEDGRGLECACPSGCEVCFEFVPAVNTHIDIEGDGTRASIIDKDEAKAEVAVIVGMDIDGDVVEFAGGEL